MAHRISSTNDDQQTDIDRVYDLVGHPVRRKVIRMLSANDPVTLDALAARIAETTDDFTEMRATVALVHVHLPKLDDAGVVSFDPRSGHVTFEQGPLKHQVSRIVEDLS